MSNINRVESLSLTLTHRYNNVDLNGSAFCNPIKWIQEPLRT